jgi:hypothetical protein
LEEAQWLAGEFARALVITEDREPTDALTVRLGDAVERLRVASRPLLEILDLERRLAIEADDGEAV